MAVKPLEPTIEILDPNANKPKVKDEYVDTLRPGGRNHQDIKAHLERTGKRIAEKERLMRATDDVLLSPTVAEHHKLNDPTVEGRRKQLRDSVRSLKSGQSKLYNGLDRIASFVSSHDSGTPYVPSVTPGELLESPQTRAAWGNPRLVHRLMNGDVPMEEFGTNPEWMLDSKKGSNFIGAPAHLAGNHESLMRLQDKIVDLAKKGQKTRGWYDAMSDMIKRVTHDDPEEADKLAQTFAITSANTGIDSNVANAMRAHNTYRRALIQGHYIPIESGHGSDSDRKLEQLLYGDSSEFGGRKVSNFYHNLMKRIDPGKKQGTTVDTWMRQAYGYPGKGKGARDDEYAFIQNSLTQAAKRLTDETGVHWDPDHVQAAAWNAIRGEDGSEARVSELGKRIKGLQSKLNPQATLFAGPDDHGVNTAQVHNEYHNGLDSIRKHVNEAADRGEVQPEDVQAYGDAVRTGQPSTRDPLGLNPTLSALSEHRDRRLRELDRARDLLEPDIHTILQVEQAQREREDLMRQKDNPDSQDFADSAMRVSPGQLNMEAIPSPAAEKLDNFEAEADHRLKDQFTEEHRPIVNKIMRTLGLGKGLQGDTRGLGDYTGKTNPFIGVGQNLPTEVGGGSLHSASEKNARLAAAMLAYVTRQNGVPFMSLHPVDPSKPDPDKPNEPPLDKSNAAYFKIKTGNVGMREWDQLVRSRNALAEKYRLDPNELPIPPATSLGGHGFVMLNMTGKFGGEPISNNHFHRLSREIVNNAGLAAHGVTLDHLPVNNQGDMVYEPWTDTDDDGQPRTPGDNLRTEIRKYGGNAALNYADLVHSQDVAPIWDKYRNWRQLARDNPAPPDEDARIEGFNLSEADAQGRPRQDRQRDPRARTQPRNGFGRERLLTLAAYCNRLMLSEDAERDPALDAEAAIFLTLLESRN